MMSRLKHFLALVYMAVVLNSCQNTVYDSSQNIANNTWNKDDKITFKVNIAEPGKYALFLKLKYTEEYPMSNLWLTIDMQDPKGKSHKQRFNIPLFSPEGYPLQDALGPVYFRKFPARKIEQRFLPLDAEQAGNYTFMLSQEMRIESLPGVKKVGLQLSKIK